MTSYPPFMNAYGNISKIIDKIKAAKTPERFTQDFLGTNLGFTGGGSKPFIPLAKRMGLLNSDGSPTSLYKKLRNPSESKLAMAEAIRKGYHQLFERNEYAHRLNKKELAGLVQEITGLESDSPTLRAITNTFDALRSQADFEGELAEDAASQSIEAAELQSSAPLQLAAGAHDLRLGYTINLYLPNSDDIAVFNAIFRSLKEHLL